jgi:hypothetical protein
MKKIISIVVFGAVILTAYNVFLIFFPLKRPAYVNKGRVENFIYSKEYYPVVLAGSSLSGIFEETKAKEILGKNYYNLYMPYWGACTGVEVLRLSNRIPKKLFVEINQVHRGTDTNMVRDIFTSPIYKFKNILPFTFEKNKLVPNMIDRFKKTAVNKANSSRPPAELYNNLLKRNQKSYAIIEDKKYVDGQISLLSNTLKEFAAKGCEIYFYEMPMDSSLRYSKLIVYERNYFMNFAKQGQFHFIPADTSRAYKTGDGEHMLESERFVYLDYLKRQLAEIDKAQQAKALAAH